MTTEYVLRAMVRNYAKGHIWDHMDSTVCQMAAEEIAHLRKVIARKEQPVEVLDKDNLLMQMEAEDRRKITEAAVRVSVLFGMDAADIERRLLALGQGMVLVDTTRKMDRLADSLARLNIEALKFDLSPPKNEPWYRKFQVGRNKRW